MGLTERSGPTGHSEVIGRPRLKRHSESIEHSKASHLELDHFLVSAKTITHFLRLRLGHPSPRCCFHRKRFRPKHPAHHFHPKIQLIAFTSSIRHSLPFHLSLPIHCLVDDNNKRRAIKNLTCHVKCNPPDVIPLPKLAEKMKDSFAAILNSMQSKNLDFFSNIARSDTALNLKFSASSTLSAKTQNQNFTNRTYCLIPPEYLFLQMAETMNFLDLLLLGFELCGTYFSGQGIDAFASTSTASPRHKPFTRANKIARFLDSDVASQTNGIAQVTQASKFLLDNSYSPRESALALMLTLPRRLGGYALPRPLLNQRINIPRSSSQLIRNDHFKCDLLWPKEGLAIEYDSDLHHVGAQKIAKDASRRDALALLGIQVITVTNKQFASMNEMDKVAHTVAKTLGIRQRNEKRYNYQTRKIQLLQQLQ